MTDDTLTPFAKRLAGSKLLTSHQLRAALAAARDDESLAEYLLRHELLTRFQIRQLRAGSTSLTVGNYVAVDFLGRGGNGIVLKARNRLMPERYVALKTFDAQNLHYTPEIVARFRREIDIVSRLEHPNLVRALDVLQTRTRWYLVLEYVPGRDLGALVRERGPLPVGEAADYALQAARGLAYAHGKGVVHRDLKPCNLLRTPDGVVKLTDLGLARFFGGGASGDVTMRGACLGTPEFMAPEQAEDARSVGPRGDLYSLGATLFHLLTAELHLSGSTYLHKLQALLTAAPRRLAEARPDVPAALAELVDRLRARDPADRPGTAEEVIAVLEPVARRPTPLSPRQLAAIVLEVLQGKATTAEAGRRHGLGAGEVERCCRRFVEAGARALDPAAQAAAVEHVPKQLAE
jgi:serine/threonine protein kinase